MLLSILLVYIKISKKIYFLFSRAKNFLKITLVRRALCYLFIYCSTEQIIFELICNYKLYAIMHCCTKVQKLICGVDYEILKVQAFVCRVDALKKYNQTKI